MSQAEFFLTCERAERILGAKSGQDARVLQAAFRAAVKRTHPDRLNGDDRRLRVVIEAYKVLKAALVTEPGERPEAARRLPPTLTISQAEALDGGHRMVRAADGRRVYVSLPAGLRVGMLVRVAGEAMRIAISPNGVRDRRGATPIRPGQWRWPAQGGLGGEAVAA